MGIIIQNPRQWFPICSIQHNPPSACPVRWIVKFEVCCMVLRLLVFSQDGVHYTIHHGIRYVCNILVHHSIFLWICRYSWTQPHCEITPIKEWMECKHCWGFELESNSCIQSKLPFYNVFCLVLIGLSNYPNTPGIGCMLASDWYFRLECEANIWN